MTLSLAAASPILTYALPAWAATTAALGGVTYASISPTNRFWGPVLYRGPSGGAPRYALTFDDGPTPGATDRILDVLADLRVHAAFFVIGVNVQQHPDLLRRIHHEGHLVGNHTYSHSHYGMMRGPAYWRDEVTRTDELIESITGVRPAMFRPPMGVKTCFVHRAARRAGQHVVTWNRRAYDGVATTTDRILDRLVPSTSAGDILMLHDGIEPNCRRETSHSVDAVRPLIQRLRDRGLSAERLDALLDVPAYARVGASA